MGNATIAPNMAPPTEIPYIKARFWDPEGVEPRVALDGRGWLNAAVVPA
jgi:hypothetical protein